MKKSAHSDVLDAIFTVFNQDNAVEKIVLAPYVVATDFDDQTTVNSLMNDIYDDNNSFYTVSLLDLDGDLAVEKKILLAKWVETKGEHVAFIWDSSSDAYDGAGDTDLAKAYVAAGNTGDRLVCVSGEKETGSNYISGILGKNLPYLPATTAWTHRQLNNVVVSVFTETECANLDTKNYGYVINIGGLNVYEGKGKTASGNYIDDTMLIDFFIARISESIFNLLANLKKLPFTDKGIGAVKAKIDSILAEATANGQITGNYLTIVPSVSSIPTADKEGRILRNVEFTFTPTGAVHALTINGVLSL
jgi:hypothetical protein